MIHLLTWLNGLISRWLEVMKKFIKVFHNLSHFLVEEFLPSILKTHQIQTRWL